jgi:DNA-directed RNA polymerase subunit RPC12/RpoP
VNATRDANTETTRYIYYCERCRTTFEVDVDLAKPIPRETVCPTCEYPRALKAFAASTTRPPTGECGPNSGC